MIEIKPICKYLKLSTETLIFFFLLVVITTSYTYKTKLTRAFELEIFKKNKEHIGKVSSNFFYL